MRFEVYVDEQRVPPELELDEDDKTAIHLAAFSEHLLAGTARLVVSNKKAKIGRLAVRAPYRGLGYGKALLAYSIDLAHGLHLSRLELDAQTTVTGLYESFGFAQVGETFLDAGLLHIKMVMDLCRAKC